MPPAPAPIRPCNLFNLTALPRNILTREVSTKNTLYNNNTRHAIAISLGIIFGIAASILIIAIGYYIYKRRNLPKNHLSPPRPWGGNGSDFVVIVPGTEKMVPFPPTTRHPDSRDSHVDDREGRCLVFCITCCGSTRTRSEGQRKQRRRHNGRQVGVYGRGSGGSGSGGSADDRTHTQPRYQGSSTYIMGAATDERISRVPHRRETPGRRHKTKDHRRPTNIQGSSLESVSARKANRKGNSIGLSEAMQYQSGGVQAPRPCVRRHRTRSPPGWSPVPTRRIQQNPQDPNRIQVPNPSTSRHQPRKPSRKKPPPSCPPSQGSDSGISYPQRIYDPRYHNRSNISIPQIPREEDCEHEHKDGERVYICCSSSNDLDHRLAPPPGYLGFGTNLPSSSSSPHHPSGSVPPPSIRIEVGAKLPEEMTNTISSGSNSRVSHLDSVNCTSTRGAWDVSMTHGEGDLKSTLTEAGPQHGWRSIESGIELEHPGSLVDFSRRSQEYSPSRSDIVTGKGTWDFASSIPSYYAESGSNKASSGLGSSASDWSSTNPNTSSISTVTQVPQPVTDSYSSIPSSRMYVSRIHTPPPASGAQNYSSTASMLNPEQYSSPNDYISIPSSTSQSSIERSPAGYDYFLAPTYSQPLKSGNPGEFSIPSSPQPDYLVITASPSPSVLSDPKTTIRESSPTCPESVSTTNSRQHTNFTTAPKPNIHNSHVTSLVSTSVPSEALTRGSRSASILPLRDTRGNPDRYVSMPQITISHESRVYAVPPRVAALSRRQDQRVTGRQGVEAGIVEATNSTGDERSRALEGEGVPVPNVPLAKRRYQATVESVVDDSDGTGDVGFVRDT